MSLECHLDQAIRLKRDDPKTQKVESEPFKCTTTCKKQPLGAMWSKDQYKRMVKENNFLANNKHQLIIFTTFSN
jgi:hypothetical protein